MKKGALAIAAVLILLVATFFISTSLQPPGHPDFAKLLPAAASYGDWLKSQGKPVPDFVDLQTLVASGQITTNDITGFESMNVTIALRRDEAAPTNVLVRCETLDGYSIVALMDGSVRTLRTNP